MNPDSPNSLSSSPYRRFDRSRLSLRPLSQRKSDFSIKQLLPLAPVSGFLPKPVRETARAIVRARRNNRSVVLLMGAHVIREGVQRYLIDLMARDLITCLAMNGAGIIHDFELALTGQTTESVARYIENGQFGLWQETSQLNGIVQKAAAQARGIGESIGEYIVRQNFSHRDLSLTAMAWQYRIPVTVHVGIGYDIVHEHPNCDGAAWGACSYTDFLIFAHVLEKIGHGVVMNFGSAVMGPEIFLKALAMVRNVTGQKADHFTSLVCDLKPLPENHRQEAGKDHALYYFRPWKTLLVRTPGRQGASYYLQLRHRQSIPALWTALTQEVEQ